MAATTHKRTHLKHPTYRGRTVDVDRSWARRFAVILVVAFMIAVAGVIYYKFIVVSDDGVDSYIPVKIKTLLGTRKQVIGKLSVVVDPGQERKVLAYRKTIEAVTNRELSELYSHEKRPELSDVRDALYSAINHKLPGKVQIRDVLIQELTVGYRD